MLEGRGEDGHRSIDDDIHRPGHAVHLVGAEHAGAAHLTGRIDDGRSRGAHRVVVVQADAGRGASHLDQPHRAARGQDQEVAGLAPAHQGLGVGLPDGVVEDEGAVKIRGEQAHAGEHSSRSPSPPRASAHRRRNTSTESS